MRSIRRRVIAASAAVLTGSLVALGAAQAQDAERALVQVAGDLYRWQNNFHFGIVYVTSEGVIVGDTINADASNWLKREIAERFNQPVKYVIFSHSHGDHASGGEVFSDTATYVMHENAAAELPLSVKDAATIRFKDRLDLTLGGRTVELHYFGPNHSDSLIFARFPAEKALFVVDLVSPGAVGFRNFPGGEIDGWIASLKQVEALEFDTLVPGHSRIGTKADMTAYRGYMKALRAEVKAQVDAGKSLEETKALVTMDKYKDWFGYGDWFALNVEGMHRYLTK